MANLVAIAFDTALASAFTAAPATATESRATTAVETAPTIRPSAAFATASTIRAELARSLAFATRVDAGHGGDLGSHYPLQIRNTISRAVPHNPQSLTPLCAWDVIMLRPSSQFPLFLQFESYPESDDHVVSDTNTCAASHNPRRPSQTEAAPVRCHAFCYRPFSPISPARLRIP